MPAKEKLSKKDKEKKLKLEAEKKAQEEEEARLQAEKEEQERREQEKKEAEERLIHENEECRMRKIQLAELDAIFEQFDADLRQERTLNCVNSKWSRYMKCDGSPDPTILPEINMYMSLWREDNENSDFEAILKESCLVLQLIDELESIMENSIYDADITDTKLVQFRTSIAELESLLQMKLDLGSHNVMSKATQLANPETGNLEYSAGNSAITLCLWGNLSKNPRIKSFEFPEKGLFFELPKVLTLTDCVVRTLFTKYDHFSSKSASFYPKIKQKETVTAELLDGNAVDGNAIDGSGDELHDNEEDEEKQTSRTDDEEEDLMDMLKKIQSGEDIDKKEESQLAPTADESVPSARQYVESDYHMPTPEPVEYEDFDGDEDAVDLRAFQVVGGVFHFNLLQMPPQPKVVKNWTITQLVDPPELEFIDYFTDQPKTEVIMAPPVVETVEAVPEVKSTSKINSKSGKAKGDSKADASKPDNVDDATKSAMSRSSLKAGGSKADLKPEAVDTIKSESQMKERKGLEGPPILITLKLPEDVYFCEEPQVVRWDSNEKQWRTDGFMNKIYTEATRQLTFRTCQFTTLALVQDTHINMPFQSWELRPRGVNHAQLTIIAAVVEVEIEIKVDGVCLTQPANRPELSHLINKWMPVPQLIKKMQAAGVNIFPSEDSFKYVKIPDKNAVAESRLYRQMALVASTMAFSWSRWNTDVNDQEKIIVQAAEHLVDEALFEEQWWLCMVTKKRCAKLKISEVSETFSDELESSEFYADLYHFLKSFASPAGIDRVENTSNKFVDAVHQLLAATRVITFA